jgi:hypothetical protein
MTVHDDTTVRVVKFSIKSLLLLTASIALAMALFTRIPALMTFLLSLAIPILLMRWQTQERGNTKLCLRGLSILSLFPLYFTSMGPYYYLMVNIMPTHSNLSEIGERFYAPAHWLVASLGNQFHQSFVEFYLTEWIQYGKYLSTY